MQHFHGLQISTFPTFNLMIVLLYFYFPIQGVFYPHSQIIPLISLSSTEYNYTSTSQKHMMVLSGLKMELRD